MEVDRSVFFPSENRDLGSEDRSDVDVSRSFGLARLLQSKGVPISQFGLV